MRWPWSKRPRRVPVDGPQSLRVVSNTGAPWIKIGCEGPYAIEVRNREGGWLRIRWTGEIETS